MPEFRGCLPVQEMGTVGKMQAQEYILCSSCISVCPKNVIRFAWSWKR